MGWIFVGTGIVGVFLPVLPTTPFMILALWMFSKSSERFHEWLFNHPVFGPSLQKWQQYRVIPPLAKLASVGMMFLSLIYLIFWSTVPAWAVASAASVMAASAWFVLSKPSRVPDTLSVAVSKVNS